MDSFVFQSFESHVYSSPRTVLVILSVKRIHAYDVPRWSMTTKCSGVVAWAYRGLVDIPSFEINDQGAEEEQVAD